MPRYIRIPVDEVTLVNHANGRRMKRQTDRFESDGGVCGNCGNNTKAIFEDDPPYSMLRWLESFILNDAKLSFKTEDKNNREIRIAEGNKVMKCIASIRKAFKSKKSGDEVLVDESHWDRIKDILESPGNVWNMVQMAQFEPYFSAWYAATEESASDKTRKIVSIPSNGAVATLIDEDSAERTTATDTST